jgi:site-specific recombinase XerD
MRELRERRLRGFRADDGVFVLERGALLSAPGFSRMVERAAVATDLGIKAHAHMLRHGAATNSLTMVTTRA